MSQNKRELIIVTSPPGMNPESWAKIRHPKATVYSDALGNKTVWRDQSKGEAVLITAAPAAEAKGFWIAEARRFGFTPTLVVLTGRKEDQRRTLIASEESTLGTKLNESQRRRVSRRVNRWYTSYSKHTDEQKIDASLTIVPPAAFGYTAVAG